MRVRISRNDLSSQKADLAVCFAYENEKHPRGVSGPLKRELALQMKAEGFEGQRGDRLVWNANGRYPSRRFLVIGLGPERAVAGEAIRLGCARASKEAANFSAHTLALTLPDTPQRQTALEARAAIEGALMGAYQFDRHLTEPHRKKVKLSAIELAGKSADAALRKAVDRAGIGARAVCLARDLVNEAPSRMTPTAMARIASKQAKSSGLGCKVLGPADLRRIGLSAMLQVARGSDEPPRVVHLTYRPTRRKTKGRVVLIGKGVTFDSGGLNLKPSGHMLTMKSDMAGAAAVLATMTALKEIGCSVEVHGLLGLTENMTGGGAYKPGDILDTYSGKTVEVGNTDAEGRLVLCDLLAYSAAELKPTQIVDVATLTGACVVALGTMATGLFTRHDQLRDALLDAASSAGEKLWPLPMYEEYIQLMQKGPADLRNVAGRWGGAITAALFLGEFLPRDIPWAHLDIAGPAFIDGDDADAPQGASGAGAPTLIRWLESQ